MSFLSIWTCRGSGRTGAYRSSEQEPYARQGCAK